MTDLRKAAEMALKFCDDIGDLSGPYPYVNGTGVVSDSRKVLQALRKALAQTEKPPVKSYCGGKPNYCTPEVTPDVDAVNMSQERVDETAKREHEAVARVDYNRNGNIAWLYGPVEPDGTLLYTAPPKREWVGLTDEEYDELMLSGDWGGSLIQATEAKLKEKNT